MDKRILSFLNFLKTVNTYTADRIFRDIPEANTEAAALPHLHDTQIDPALSRRA